MATKQNDAEQDLFDHKCEEQERMEEIPLVNAVGKMNENKQEKDISDSVISEHDDELSLDLNNGDELQPTENISENVTERSEPVEESEAVQTGDRDENDKEDVGKENDEGMSTKDDEGRDDEEHIDEEEEETEPETEMTEEEKKAMYNAVCEGDIATLQNCLDKPNADLNMTWFNENMLMVAMRTGQMRMAEFLIDIGIDINYEIDLIDLHQEEKTGTKRFDCYRKSCRQIAYENGHDFIVELIDLQSEHWFPYTKKTPRWYKFTKRPPPPPLPRVPGEEEEVEEEEELEGEGNENGEKGEEGGDEKKQNEVKKDDDIDSGHHSGNEIKEVEDNLSFLSGDNLRRHDFELIDDGYWSLTQRSSPYMCAPEKLERPGLLSRGTKASFLLRKHTNQLLDHRKCSNSAKERNVTVVQAVGSYAQESRRWKRKSVDQGSVESIPFLARMHSAITTCSEPVRATQSNFSSSRRQRPLTTQSAFTQVTKILGESRLLRPQKEPPLPYINTTQHKSPFKRTTKVNPWCHGNSTGVINKLSNVRIQNKIVDPNFYVERQLYQRTRNSYSAIS
ncbi:uncharacterized protein LOC110460601 [Mizuhopecten yessoensis]|uniref:Uncharacterized protein n=1 Tax=Mizuhopecten yessoensis TaxID=6573 RepID=A0A210Q238_MIZYE|nr:uncharacterized protein LOC110460601 [Mizuhopecten yessoensis]XP_021369269.1 uncharacterized protein LOC110460601 [Mizuhopecten yessoensis]XP_021369270.1 uncharacterized protein LOC110460601 [Mizuhopecten yessoensis]XP_021369271.1 uncharacterized protein LOC110460601 [Mizuhopecten yessoensis]XP_021369272.1 uncharacterized protein LOC110460601 [Mizuhopecten yessoensis]XP_021369274.1 uncharacterized protein LOC110460601 [Mizuhopecten yessoensis]XP_021369275.1 uncharacterized protein LOC11046